MDFYHQTRVRTLLFPSPCVAGRSRVTATAVARGGHTEEGASSFFHSLSGLLGVRDPPSTSLTESATEDVSKSKGPANPDESYRAIWIPGTYVRTCFALGINLVKGSVFATASPEVL